MQKKGIDTKSNFYEESMMFHGAANNVMGTRFDILIIGQDTITSHEIWNETIAELQRLDRIFNRFDNTSETYKVNSEAPLAAINVSCEMWEVLQNCQMYHARTSGLFDITLNNFSNVLLNESDHSVAFAEKNTSLDFGGYAKGYALVKLQEMITQKGVNDCLIDFGNSSIMGIGCHPYGDAWKVSIENPYENDTILEEITLKNSALSVSGNSPSYTGHIFRPDTGVSVEDHKLVSIVAENSLDAEVLSTVWMMATEDEKASIAEKFNIQKITSYSL